MRSVTAPNSLYNLSRLFAVNHLKLCELTSKETEVRIQQKSQQPSDQDRTWEPVARPRIWTSLTQPLTEGLLTEAAFCISSIITIFTFLQNMLQVLEISSKYRQIFLNRLKLQHDSEATGKLLSKALLKQFRVIQVTYDKQKPVETMTSFTFD